MRSSVQYHLVPPLTCCTAWYIPPSWTNTTSPLPEPANILDAAHQAYKLSTDSANTIPYSAIPLIVHQTWKNRQIETWPVDVIEGVETWLRYATVPGEELAYFFWLDNGCQMLIQEHEPQIEESMKALPLPVERSDVFRVVVTNSIGGIVSTFSHSLVFAISLLCGEYFTPFNNRRNRGAFSDHHLP